MFSGDRSQLQGLWVVAVGVVTIGLGAVILVSPPREFQKISALALLGVGILLILRGVIVYRRPRSESEESNLSEESRSEPKSQVL
jgi:uncharacterized membrane protein HdeD (DUF308 family)